MLPPPLVPPPELPVEPPPVEPPPPDPGETTVPGEYGLFPRFVDVVPPPPPVPGLPVPGCEPPEAGGVVLVPVNGLKVGAGPVVVPD